VNTRSDRPDEERRISSTTEDRRRAGRWTGLRYRAAIAVLVVMAAVAIQLVSAHRSRATTAVSSAVDFMTVVPPSDQNAPSVVTIAPTAPPAAPIPDLTPLAGADDRSVPINDRVGATPAKTVLDSALVRARRSGVPNAEGNAVVLSECAGGTSNAHWGYYNNGALGGSISEPDGVIVPLGAVCINPAQPDVYSSLLHELGHKYFWEHGLWESTKSQFGGSERAAECFAKVFGATVFGEGGCSDTDAQRMRIMLGD
jgi:hypothetical protein